MGKKSPFHKMQDANKARQASMLAMRARGWTLERIATHWGLSKQRVHQILGGAGLSDP